MSSEKATRKTICEKIPQLHPQSIESRTTGDGIPDIWTGPAAIECKCLKKWPAKATSNVVLDHPLTLLQHRWLNNRWKAGYGAFVMLQVGRMEWFLFAAPDSGVLRSSFEVPRARLFFLASAYWSNGLDGYDLAQMLKMPVKGFPLKIGEL